MRLQVRDRGAGMCVIVCVMTEHVGGEGPDLLL
jgi:hypothetical protein